MLRERKKDSPCSGTEHHVDSRHIVHVADLLSCHHVDGDRQGHHSATAAHAAGKGAGCGRGQAAQCAAGGIGRCRPHHLQRQGGERRRAEGQGHGVRRQRERQQRPARKGVARHPSAWALRCHSQPSDIHQGRPGRRPTMLISLFSRP